MAGVPDAPEAVRRAVDALVTACHDSGVLQHALSKACYVVSHPHVYFVPAFYLLWPLEVGGLLYIFYLIASLLYWVAQFL